MKESKIVFYLGPTSYCGGGRGGDPLSTVFKHTSIFYARSLCRFCFKVEVHYVITLKPLSPFHSNKANKVDPLSSAPPLTVLRLCACPSSHFHNFHYLSEGWLSSLAGEMGVYLLAITRRPQSVEVNEINL